MKKFLFLALAAVMLLPLASCSPKQDTITPTKTKDENSYEVGKESFEYSITDQNTIEITSYTGGYERHAVTLPSEIEGIKVTSIGPQAFYYDNSITSVTIPDTVTYIGDWAFAGCEYLETVNLPASLEVLGDGVFYLCTSIKEIELPETLTVIGQYDFYGCSALAAVDIPASVISIGDSAFWRCVALSSVTGMEGVKTIGSYVFNGCEVLEGVTIPPLTDEIGDHAFNGCEALTLKVITGSYAETYASANGYKFTN